MPRRKTPEEWQRALNRWTRALGKFSAEAVAETAKATAKKAKQLVPVDEGELRRSIGPWKTKRKRNVIKGGVGSGVKHAHMVEYGTRKMKAQPYMRPALKSQVPDLERRLERAIRDSAKKAEAAR